MSFLPNLLCPSCVPPSGARGSPAMGLHAGISVPPLLHAFCSSGLAIPTLVRPSTHRIGRRRNKTHALLHLGTVQLGAPVRESKGVCASKWGVLGTEAFAEEHPCALHPWAMPRRATELPVTAPAAASWGHRSFPFPVPRLPKSLENPPAFEQTL